MAPIKHGQNITGARTRVYRIWLTMVSRCHNPNHDRYKWYGAKGITVCDRWRQFENFYADMGDPPDGFTIDRKDGTKNYERGNCRWTTVEEQQNNRCNNCLVKLPDGRVMSLTKAAREMGFSRSVILQRVRRGWPEEHLFDPIGSHTRYSNPLT